MCGIAGFKLAPGGNLDKAFEVFEHLLVQSQIRGKHATGVSWVRGTKVVAAKAPMPAEDFIKSDKWKQIKDERPTSMIAHCRYSTSGDASNNWNNQPITYGTMSLAHNGLVSMATKDEFQKLYKVQTKTENDSEVILAKMEKIWDKLYSSGNDEYEPEDVLAAALRTLYKVDTPIFALALLQSNGDILLTRDHIRPLWVFEVPNYGMHGFGSTEDILSRAFSKMKWKSLHEAAAWGKLDPYTICKLGQLNYEAENGAYTFDVPHAPDVTFFRPKLIDRAFLNNSEITLRGSDLNLDNPEAKAGDHRKNKRESFKRYSAAAIRSWEIDPNYPLMNYLFQRYELSKSQEYWACFLYGVFYHPGTVFYVMQEFPEFEKVDLGRLQRWHDQNWRQLRYNKDRKYEKGHFVQMVKSYIDLIGSQTPTSQDEFFGRMLKGTPVQNFHQVTQALTKLLRFGRYSVYIYTECLARCMGLPMEADTVFLKEASSPRAGLCYVLEKPDWAKATLQKQHWSYLEAELDCLMAELRHEYPSVKVDHWFMESCLCAYKGFFANGRYLGYYLDRMADEILQMENEEIASGVDWKVLWQFRRETMPWEYLGEYASPQRLKVVAKWRKTLIETGHMIGTWPMIKRGLLPKTEITDAKIKQ